MTDEERKRVVELLHQSHRQFLEVVQGVGERQWTHRPDPAAWSVGEVAEHIVLAEDLLFANMERALDAAPDPEAETRTAGKTALLERALPNRGRRVAAPPSLVPATPRPLADVLSCFQEARRRVLSFAEQTDRALDAHLREHPFPFFGILTAYQWLLYIPLHHIRHNQQIGEIKASAGFPR